MGEFLDMVKGKRDLKLQGIIAPEYLSPEIGSYKGIPVQRVQTTILPGHPDYEKSKVLHCSLANAELFKESFQNGRVLHLYPQNKDHRKSRYVGDNAHEILFSNMCIETPCLVIDGDVLFVQFNLKHLQDKSTRINDTGCVYIHKEEDKHSVLRAGTNLRPHGAGIIHLSDGIMGKIYNHGFTLARKED